jgi:HAD superfamily hydrolase (TIGR01509 family)
MAAIAAGRHGGHTSSHPGLIIFDCDGVLVDSEPLAMRVLLEGIAARGVEIDEALAYERLLGRSLASVIETVQRDFGVALERDSLEQMREQLYTLFRQELRAISGIAEALEKLTIPVCVASSSQPERIRLSLQLTGLAARFGDNIFSASMVAEGKPAPDLFLLAASRMRVTPDRCIVIEDSPAGIEAAQRAGMRVFAFTGGSHARSPAHRERLEALAPDAVFDNMAGLPELIASQAESGTRRDA